MLKRRLGLGVVVLLGAGLVAASALFFQFTVLANNNGSVYVPVSPVRLLDTRLTGQALGPNSSLNLQVANTRQVPAGATAVAINVTVTNTTAASYLTAYPTGETPPLASNLNWLAGETLANESIVTIGAGYSISFYNDTGKVDVVVDLQGYFIPSSSSGSYFVPLTPARIADTRSGSGKPYAGQTMGSQSYLNIQVAGVGGIPTSGVTAVVAHVTVTDTTAASYLTVYPAGEGWPGTSTLNWTSDMTVANRVITPLGTGGQITVFNDAGAVDVVVDVSGYFISNSSTDGAGVYYPIAPTRLLDTRVNGGSLTNGSVLTEQVGGVDGVGAMANAVVVNLTATDPTASSYFTLTPNPTSSPATSDLNWSTGETVANLDIVSLNNGGDFSLYNDQGVAQAIIDVSGYFVPVSGVTSAVEPCTSATLTLDTMPVIGGNLKVTANGTCPSGTTAYYTYWYMPPGNSVWEEANGATTSAIYSYGSSSWPTGDYQLLATVSSRAGVFQSVSAATAITITTNPTSNLSDAGFSNACYTYGSSSANCVAAETAGINSAQLEEGVTGLNWNATLAGLTEAEREFVVANEERVSRGLMPIAGLTVAANTVAQQGANNNADPNGMAVPGAIAFGGNWAEDYGSLGAMFDWMYNDGLNSFNIDCTSSNTSGCWGHRDNILLNTTSGEFAPWPGYTWTGGAACAPEDGTTVVDSCTLLWVEVPSSSVSYQFTWAQAVADGA